LPTASRRRENAGMSKRLSPELPDVTVLESVGKPRQLADFDAAKLLKRKRGSDKEYVTKVDDQRVLAVSQEHWSKRE